MEIRPITIVIPDDAETPHPPASTFGIGKETPLFARLSLIDGTAFFLFWRIQYGY